VGSAGFLNTGGAVAGVCWCAAGLLGETKDQKVSDSRLKSGMVGDMQLYDTCGGARLVTSDYWLW
jgi:hypothetical protein